MHDESGDPAASADVGTPGACRVFFLPKKRHLRTVVVHSPPALCLSAIEYNTKSGGRVVGVSFGPLFSARGGNWFFLASVDTCAVIKTSFC